MHWIHPARNPINRRFTIFLVVAIQRQVRAFSLEGRSSKPLHSNDHDEESNSSSQDPQSSIFEKDLKPEPPNKANKWQHPGKSATTRAQSKLGAKPHSTLFPKFPQLQLFGMQGASAMAPRVDVSTILLGSGFSLWLSSWNQWLERLGRQT